MEVPSAITTRNLRKVYRVKKRLSLIKSREEVVEALKGISFEVRYGEIVGLLGPNGAGKTTTIKIISTLLIPDAGEAYVDGYDVVRQANEVRKRIGLMLTVEKGFYGKLTGKENLEYFAALYGLSRSEAERRINHLIKVLELDKLGAVDKLFEEYSLGMKARLSIARALLKNSPVLLLDEPTLGLDPPSARKIRELVKSLAREEGKAVLYTTHNMFEAELVCDKILLINKGLIVAEGTPDELKSKIPKLRVITITVRNGERVKIEEALAPLVTTYTVTSNEFGETTVKVSTKSPEEILGEVIRALVACGCDISSVRIEEPTLEDVFIYFSQ